MKKKYLLVAFAALIAGLFSGCGDDEVLPYYSDIENEKVVFELDSVPAYVECYHRDHVLICYSQYADTYWEQRLKDKNSIYELSTDVLDDVESHRIGVSLSEFQKFDIPYYCKVYVTASVTNNSSYYHDPNQYDSGFQVTLAPKSYLINIVRRK